MITSALSASKIIRLSDIKKFQIFPVYYCTKQLCMQRQTSPFFTFMQYSYLIYLPWQTRHDRSIQAGFLYHSSVFVRFTEKQDQGKPSGGREETSIVWSESGWGKQIRADQSAGTEARILLPYRRSPTSGIFREANWIRI